MKGIGYAEAVKEWKPKYEKAEKGRVDVTNQFNAFTDGVKRMGEERERAAAEKEARDNAFLKDKEKRYGTRIASLDADNQRLGRVLDHFRSTGARPGGGQVPGVSVIPGAPGSGSADDVPALRAALDGLARQCAETTVMFLECRSSWKGVTAK